MSSLRRTTLAVLAAEALVLLALWWLERHFTI
jgi:hypothetical protein